MFIYCITNKINNKKYVGLTTKPIKLRFYYHKYLAEHNKGYYLHAAMRKYGIENFEIEKLDTAKNIKELKEKEIEYIRKLDTFRNGYNLTEGGDYNVNKGFTLAFIHDEIIRVSVKDFNNFNLVHPNKNKITILKDNVKRRIDTSDLALYESIGWVSVNKNFTTVRLEDGTITKIKSQDFDKNKHQGVRKGLQNYYNPKLLKFESLTPDKVDINLHYNKNKTKYKITKNSEIYYTLNLENIPAEFGGKVFRYMIKQNKDLDIYIIDENILLKLKPKTRDYNLINTKLEILKLC